MDIINSKKITVKGLHPYIKILVKGLHPYKIVKGLHPYKVLVQSLHPYKVLVLGLHLYISMIQEMTDYHYRNRSIQVRHEITITIFTIIEPELSTKAEENIAHNHTKILPRPQNLPARQTYYLLLNNNNIITNCIFSITDSILTAATEKIAR